MSGSGIEWGLCPNCKGELMLVAFIDWINPTAMPRHSFPNILKTPIPKVECNKCHSEFILYGKEIWLLDNEFGSYMKFIKKRRPFIFR